jgi:DNA-directed RNA polymerase specialized sigma subunit
MEINEVYAFFGRPRLHENKIKRIEVTLEELRSCLLPGAIRYDKEKVDSSPKDSMADVFARIDELERELESERENKKCAILEIDRALMQVPEGPYKTMLAEYYIGRISIDKIADGMGVSRRHCFRIKKKAVETFAEIMNRKENNGS